MLTSMVIQAITGKYSQLIETTDQLFCFCSLPIRNYVEIYAEKV